MKTLPASRTYCQYFSAFQVQKGEKISIMYGKKRVRVKVGDWVVTDGTGTTFVANNAHFVLNCHEVPVF